MPSLKFLKRIGYADVNTLDNDDSAFFYVSGLMVDADGSPHAYHPPPDPGLDYIGNAGKPGNWWALVTDSGAADGNPVVQKPTDPAPGYYISTTSLEDKTRPTNDPTRYVNAETINFIVLPARLNLGATLGDFAVVIRPDTLTYDYAVYADVGPANKIGEASIALAQGIGINSNPKTGGIAHGILYIVFPKSAGDWPMTQPDIDQNAASLFSQWGGLDTARACYPDLPWRSSSGPNGNNN